MRARVRRFLTSFAVTLVVFALLNVVLLALIHLRILGIRQAPAIPFVLWLPFVGWAAYLYRLPRATR